jgi:D-amino-acid dehydrogenase
MFEPESPLHISPGALPEIAGWLWSFWRHCNAADFKAGCAAWTQLTDHIMESMDALVAEGVQLEMHRSGLLFVFLSESTMRHVARQISAAGHSGEPLVGRELHEMEPILSDRVVAGLLIQQERHVRPESFCQGLLDRIQQMGVEVRSGVTVTGGVVERESLRAVHSTAGDIVADQCLITAGALSGRVSAVVAGVPLPIQAGKGYALTVTGRPAPFSRPLYLDEARLGCSPFVGGYRFAGTMELSGLNDRLVPERIAAIRQAARRYLTLASDATDGEEWVGMRPLTSDGVPAIGLLPSRRNVYVATGHQMLGVTSAVTTARLVADLITDGRTSVNLSPFDPGRLSGR